MQAKRAKFSRILQASKIGDFTRAFDTKNADRWDEKMTFAGCC